MSGNLEVRVVGGKLLHSKKGGAGFVDTDAKTDKIIEGVEATSLEDDLAKIDLAGGGEGVLCSFCGKEQASKKCKKRHKRCKEETIH